MGWLLLLVLWAALTGAAACGAALSLRFLKIRFRYAVALNLLQSMVNSSSAYHQGDAWCNADALAFACHVP